MRTNIVKLLILICLFFTVPTTIHAASNPPSQNIPLDIKSNFADFNRKTGINTYKGNIHMDRENDHVRGEQGFVYLEKNTIQKTRIIGTPAHYWATDPKNSQNNIDATAKIIEYYPEEKKVVLIGNATIRRGKDIIQGAQIIYHINNAQIKAFASNKEQTHIILSSRTLNS